jgi:hypothetical protein
MENNERRAVSLDLDTSQQHVPSKINAQLAVRMHGEDA